MHPAFFYSILAIMTVIALATTPGAPFGDFANTFIGVVFTVFAGSLGILTIFSATLVGLLSFGIFGWLAIVAALLLGFRFQLSTSFIIAALGLFAVMLVVV